MSSVVELFFRERNMKREKKRIDCYKGERERKGSKMGSSICCLKNKDLV